MSITQEVRILAQVNRILDECSGTQPEPADFAAIRQAEADKLPCYHTQRAYQMGRSSEDM